MSQIIQITQIIQIRNVPALKALDQVEIDHLWKLTVTPSWASILQRRLTYKGLRSGGGFLPLRSLRHKNKHIAALAQEKFDQNKWSRQGSYDLGANWRLANTKSSMIRYATRTPHACTCTKGWRKIEELHLTEIGNKRKHSGFFVCLESTDVDARWHIGYTLALGNSVCLLGLYVLCCFVQGWLRRAVLAVDARRHAGHWGLGCTFAMCTEEVGATANVVCMKTHNSKLK